MGHSDKVLNGHNTESLALVNNNCEVIVNYSFVGMFQETEPLNWNLTLFISQAKSSESER